MKARYILFVLFLGIVAWSASATLAQPSEIVIAQSTDATSLDPAFRGDTATGNVVGHIFDPVMLRTSDMDIEPHLAESVEQVDETTWRVTLRDGITFTNGEPLDAEAVKFSIDRILDPELQAPTRRWFEVFTGVEVVDDRTLEITTDGPDPLFEARMTLLFPVPREHVQEVDRSEFAREPVGTGPYRLESWAQDDSVTLVQNEDYWGDAPGFERVTFRVVPEELSRVSALRTGEADLIVAVSPEQAGVLQDEEDVRLEMSPSTRVMVLAFDSDVAPADQEAFRRAVALAVDREAIIEGLLDGFVEPVTSIFSPGIPGWPQDQAFDYPHDPERARELVDEHGFGDVEVTLESPAGRYPYDRDTALAVGQMLEDVGLNVQVRPQEWGTFFEDLQEGDMSAVYLMGHGNVWLDPFPQLEAFLHSEGFLSTWSDPRVDELLAASNEVRGQEREAIFGDTLEVLHEDVAVVPLYAQASLYGVSEQLDWEPRIDDIIRVQEMQPAGQ